MLNYWKIIIKNEKFKYFLSGILSFVIDNFVLIIVTATILKDYEKQDILILGFLSTAKTISSSIGLTFSFILNRQWAFKATDGNIKKQIIKFIFVFVFNFFFAILLYTIFSQILFLLKLSRTMVKLLSNLSAETIKMITTFVWYKYFVFNSREKSLP
jgi:putative flippase GtrA